ncbi:TetR/AcrR family transcriptional regulator [Pseudochelatococcus sp. B33]
MGRPRKIETEAALDAALAVFWRKGFEGASYADLTKATGVERPALYAAFGNKEELFRLALQRYYEHYMDYVPEGLKQPTSYDVATYILRGAVELCTRYPGHTGCFGVNGALACSDSAEPIRKALIDARASGENALRMRFERAKVEGDLPDTADSGTLAAFLMAVLHGIAVQAKAGFSREALMAVAEQALSTWPSGRRHNL